MTRVAALGAAVNGAPIHDQTGGGAIAEANLARHQSQYDTLQTNQLDGGGAHAGRGGDDHDHVKPTCAIGQMANADAIIGRALDGSAICGDNNPDGSGITASVLDVFNGQGGGTLGYRHHA